MSETTCPSCAERGRDGYCAPLRCYCGHESCHAFASWTPLLPPNVTPIKPKRKARASSWDTREESTWIDKV